MISYTQLIPVIVKGMQEQQDIIERQERELTATKTKLADMEKKMAQFELALQKLATVSSAAENGSGTVATLE